MFNLNCFGLSQPLATHAPFVILTESVHSTAHLHCFFLVEWTDSVRMTNGAWRHLAAKNSGCLMFCP